MPFQDHLSSQDILRLADGELSARQAAKARRHLAACWTCRAQQTRIGNTIADFVAARSQDSHCPLPLIDGPRALLKARLAQVSSTPRLSLLSRVLQPAYVAGIVAYATALLILAFVAMWSLHGFPIPPSISLTAAYAAPLPDRSLTPGSVRPISSSDVCAAQDNEKTDAIPASVQTIVLEKYRIPKAHPRDYELDYLITPELGGAMDVRNLWPEPHSSVWNSYVKDDLETRLHQLVCEGKVDLSTAQQEIATNWISAYKKYFDTDRPIRRHLT